MNPNFADYSCTSSCASTKGSAKKSKVQLSKFEIIEDDNPDRVKQHVRKLLGSNEGWRITSTHAACSGEAYDYKWWYVVYLVRD